MNAAHKIGKLKNRLARLKKNSADLGADLKGPMVARIHEIEEILRQVKK